MWINVVEYIYMFFFPLRLIAANAAACARCCEFPTTASGGKILPYVFAIHCAV